MKNIFIKISAGVAYVAMIVVNYLANSLPINNRSTGEISNAYENLFTPTGLTFSIWGLIYLMLGAFMVYQFTKSDQKHEGLLKKVNILFIASSLANIAWIFAWHYDLIGLSVLIMVALLLLLIRIADMLRKQQLTSLDNIFIRTPFSLYFGWITVATIANITVFLVSIGWDAFGIADYIVTSIVLVIGALIGILRLSKDKHIPYGLVLVWAYLGIFHRHLAADELSGAYPSIIATVIVCLILFVIFIGRVYYLNSKHKKVV